MRWRSTPTPTAASASVQVRYQDPETYGVVETRADFHTEELALAPHETSPRFRLAAAVGEYAELLRRSHWSHGFNLKEVAAVALHVRGLLPEDPGVAEFAELTARAARIGAHRPTSGHTNHMRPPLRPP